ncbi:MAG: ABC transporter permease, partial [Cyclobacteriaceae bacterium]|nr:ABC transporter permease [Cyclobacteriaceae bacterium]
MKDAPAYPPRLALRFFRWYCHPRLADHIEGDLLEVYTERVRKGKLRADMLFIVDVLLLFRRGIIRPAEGYQQANAYSMYKSYWKIGWRNLWNNKTYSLINIGGLGVGLTVAMLIGLWVVDELHYNRSFDNYERIATVYHNLTFDGRIFSINTAPYPLGAELKNNFAELESVVEATEPTDHVVGISGKRLSGKTMFVDPEFASVFSLHILEGSTNGLGSLRSVMLSKSLAKSLLGENAVGTTVKLDNRDELLVTAVFEDLPTNSALGEVRMLVPMDYFFTLPEHREQKTLWGGFDFQCFVMLKRGQSFGPLESKIGRFLADRSTEQAKTLKPEGILFPMSRWHLYADFKDGKNIGGKIKYVWMFGTVGIFVLLLACINFMNLSTARSERRSKEVGVRKVMGSMRSQLVQQFLSESFLVVTAGFMLAVVVVSMSLPLFNAMTDKQISIPWNNGYFLLTAASFIVITSLLAGSYPAVYLSAFSPVRVLKGALTPSRQASLPRQVLVVFQFTVSIALIITTIIVFQQLQYAKNRPAGFDREAIIYVEMKSKELRAANYNLLRNDLVATRVVTNMGTSNFPITGGMGAEAAITWEGKDPSVQPIIAMNSCSFDYPQTSGFEFLQGRDFSPEFRTDSAAMIVNEEAAKLFAGNDHRVLGKKVTWDGKEHEIIGVIKDQIRWSPFS